MEGGKRILLMDSGSYNTFGGSAKALRLLYDYLNGLGAYHVELLGDFSRSGVSGSITADEVFKGGRHSSADYYRMISRRFFFKGRAIDVYDKRFFEREYDLVVLNSRMDVPIMDEYRTKHPGVKTMYIDRAGIITNNAYALGDSLLAGFLRVLARRAAAPFSRRAMVKSTSFLGSLGTVYIIHLLRGWLDAYVGISPEQVRLASKFFTKSTDIAYITIGVGAEYRKLPGFKRSYIGGLYVGRLDERQKHVSSLLHGVRRVIDLHPELAGIELLRIVGDGPDREEYERLSGRLGLGKNVTFLGTRLDEELVKEYNDCGFYVSASEWEGLGRAFVEAMSCGRPLLLNNMNNVIISEDWKTRMIEDGVDGMVYAYGDTEDFARKFFLMYSDTSALDRMGERAMEIAQKGFSLERQNERYAREIRKLVGE
jgi:glycosyltransferase involved in cell wall biosynthesis